MPFSSRRAGLSPSSKLDLQRNFLSNPVWKRATAPPDVRLLLPELSKLHPQTLKVVLDTEFYSVSIGEICHTVQQKCCH